MSLTQFAGLFESECNTKTNKNALEIALVLHVLWHRIGTMLNLKSEPTPAHILNITLNMALVLHACLLSYGAIAEQVSVK